MKKLKRVMPFMLSVVVVSSMAVTPTIAQGTNDAPQSVESVEVSGFMTEVMALKFNDTNWMNAIKSVSVNEKEYTKGTINSWENSKDLWEVGSATGAYGSYTALKLVSPSTFPATIKISADGYKDLTLKITKNTSTYPNTYDTTVVPNAEDVEKVYSAIVKATANGQVTLSAEKDLKEDDSVTITTTPNAHYETDVVTVTGESGNVIDVQKNSEGIYNFKMPAENVNVSVKFKEKITKLNVNDVNINKDLFGNSWELTFKNADDYINSITDVQVNGTSWTEQSYNVSQGGQYYVNKNDNKLVFSAKDFSSNPTITVLKSGDVVTIAAKGYDNLTFKLVIDKNGNAFLTEDDGEGDPYNLHVKIEGSFEAAIKGQKNYDGISSASVGGATGNKNSSVKVYGALVNKETEPADNDWEELDNATKIKLDGSKCKVSIVPDTANGTPADSDSGMRGVYTTISSDLTLNGTPKDPGTYLISVSITDDQGRTAVSNTLPFKVYSGNEALSDRLKEENLKKYSSGLYAWDIMEPWAIKNFGSNVKGEKESVRVPKGLEVWFGSHESGTYGYLGYDLPWKDVVNGNIPQTLYIPDGCNLTLTNMEILSSVRIVVEKGAKLTLSDSVIQGIVDVKDGGTFSMNYDAYNNKFTTGSSICGQLRLEDGAILENAAIYSHANYLANGKLTDRNTSDPVVTATGNTTVKGQVFINGDADGDGIGQTALQINGTLKLEDGSVLTAIGGEGVINENAGGTAINIKNGKIIGNGKIVAIGGKTLWGDGGNAVTGNGTIDVASAFVQGATASAAKKRQAGLALGNNIEVTAKNLHVKNGEISEKYGVDDALSDLYWKVGIDTTPPLDNYITSEVKNILSLEGTLDKTYYGNAVNNPIIKAGDKILTEGKDYKISFKDVHGNVLLKAPVKVGTYTIIINGLGEYSGMTLSKTFNITEKSTYTDLPKNNDPSNSENILDKINSEKNNSNDYANNISANNNSKKSVSVVKNDNAVKTGDYMNVFLWIMLAIISCGTLTGICVKQIKRKK